MTNEGVCRAAPVTPGLLNTQSDNGELAAPAPAVLSDIIYHSLTVMSQSALVLNHSLTVVSEFTISLDHTTPPGQPQMILIPLVKDMYRLNNAFMFAYLFSIHNISKIVSPVFELK